MIYSNSKITITKKKNDFVGVTTFRKVENHRSIGWLPTQSYGGIFSIEFSSSQTTIDWVKLTKI